MAAVVLIPLRRGEGMEMFEPDVAGRCGAVGRLFSLDRAPGGRCGCCQVNREKLVQINRLEVYSIFLFMFCAGLRAFVPCAKAKLLPASSSRAAIRQFLSKRAGVSQVTF
jgi:hypothetical protein